LSGSRPGERWLGGSAVSVRSLGLRAIAADADLGHIWILDETREIVPMIWWVPPDKKVMATRECGTHPTGL